MYASSKYIIYRLAYQMCCDCVFINVLIHGHASETLVIVVREDNQTQNNQETMNWW